MLESSATRYFAIVLHNKILRCCQEIPLLGLEKLTAIRRSSLYEKMQERVFT